MGIETRKFKFELPKNGGVSLCFLGSTRSGKTTFLKEVVNDYFKKHLKIICGILAFFCAPQNRVYDKLFNNQFANDGLAASLNFNKIKSLWISGQIELFRLNGCKAQCMQNNRSTGNVGNRYRCIPFIQAAYAEFEEPGGGIWRNGHPDGMLRIRYPGRPVKMDDAAIGSCNCTGRLRRSGEGQCDISTGFIGCTWQIISCK